MKFTEHNYDNLLLDLNLMTLLAGRSSLVYYYTIE